MKQAKFARRQERADAREAKRERAEARSLDMLTLPKAHAGRLDAEHPVVTLVYFLGIAVITMFTLNPVVIGISFLGAVCCTGILVGSKKLLLSLAYSLPMLLVMSLVNPVFVHKGETILFFLNDNPITLEATLYGVSSAFMLVSVFYWFKCYSILMTSDKFVYLFGRAVPQLSLVLSMSLAFIPKLKKQYRRISAVQKSMGMYTGKSMTDKILFRFRIISCLIGWALENSVQTSDSMSARGYGLKGRSSYSMYRFRKRDLCSLSAVAVLIALTAVFLGLCANAAFYPVLRVVDFSPAAVVTYVAFGLLVMYGTVLEIQERLKWKYFVSKI